MSVIFSRAPLRISLGGGGTDLPSYYREHGGFLVAGAIDKYIYMLMHTVFQRRYKMKYSETEDVDEIASIQHPILRETLAAPLARQPARDRLGRRRPGRDRDGLLRGVHGRAAQGPRARAADLDHPGRARRGGVRDRDRRAAGAVRQAGSVRRRPRRDLRLHVRHRRQRRRRAARARARDAARPARAAAAVLHRRGARAPPPSSPTRTSGPRTGDAEMLENLHRTKEIGRPEPRPARRTAICSPTPS